MRVARRLNLKSAVHVESWGIWNKRVKMTHKGHGMNYSMIAISDRNARSMQSCLRDIFHRGGQRTPWYGTLKIQIQTIV